MQMTKNAEPEYRSRAFRRERLDIVGTLSFRGSPLVPVSVIDVSGNGVSIFAPSDLTVGTPVIIHLDRMGATRGTVVRTDGTLLGIQFEDTPDLCDMRQRRIWWRAAMNRDRRARPRATPTPPRGHWIGVTVVSMADGEGAGEVVDISDAGISIRTDIPLRAGEHIVVGGVAGRVVRTADGMTGVRYDNAEDARHIALRSISRDRARRGGRVPA
jgi:hypothetical protein